jgi:hypothetical protein
MAVKCTIHAKTNDPRLMFFSLGKLSNTSLLIMGHYLETEAAKSKHHKPIAML